MAHFIAILEDNAGRIEMMRTCLARDLPALIPYFSENAEEMIAWLGEHIGDVTVISLDHDLPVRVLDGVTIDCGTGRQVADFLATLAPACATIVHSSNEACAYGMVSVLRQASWPCTRVYPSDGDAWISDAWIDRVKRRN